MELDCDNVTTCGICCVVEWWLEVQQMGQNFAILLPYNNNSVNVLQSKFIRKIFSYQTIVLDVASANRRCRKDTYVTHG